MEQFLQVYWKHLIPLKRCPVLHEAIRKVIEAGRKHGKVVGRPAGSPDEVQQYVEQGFQLFQAPTDIGFMTAGAKHYLDPLGKSGGQKAEKRALY